MKRSGFLTRGKPMRKKALRETRERDVAYLGWLHERIPCIACLIEGVPERPLPFIFYPIEACHQKHCGGIGGLLGKRPPDRDSCPLCQYHHRLAPDACDPAQRKFWDRLGVNVGDFCAALYAAFQAGGSGADVVRRFGGGAKL